MTTDKGNQAVETNPDELFARSFIEEGVSRGFYIECQYSDIDGDRIWYALIMPKDEYERLLAETNDVIRESAEAYGDRYQAWNILPWSVFMEQPTMAYGTSRREALLNSMQALKTIK